MADARELLERITVQDGEIFNPISTVAGYRAFQQFLEQLLERIEHLEERGCAGHTTT